MKKGVSVVQQDHIVFKGGSVVGIEEVTASDQTSPSPRQTCGVCSVCACFACPIFLEGASGRVDGRRRRKRQRTCEVAFLRGFLAWR